MASTASSVESTGIVVCGCGPTGAMLAALLSRYSVPTIVLEKEQRVNTDPRGIALDEDGIRFLQACGIYDKIFTDIGQCMQKFMFIGGVHNDLTKKPFMVMDYNTTEGGTGHPGFICHKQPALETHLRKVIERSDSVELRLGATLHSIREDEDGVLATYRDAEGESRQIRSRFLVGADGKTGFVRKKYLEPRGIRLEQVSSTAYEETWVALNWKISLPTPETHPNFPLWAKGYTPEWVYDAFFPADFRFLCNPERAAVCGRFGPHEDRLWRFEFVVLDGEDGDVMSEEEAIRRVVYPYLTHPGSRYGLKDNTIQYPSDCIQVLRCRPFRFSARSCGEWALGRIALCGDAAHVFPPFGGQGIASGFRDAISLAWRLAIMSSSVPNPGSRTSHHTLLQGWYTERQQQLEKSLSSTIENGAYVTEHDPVRILVRDWYLWVVQLVPKWRHLLEMGYRREGMTQYQWHPGKGMVFLHDMGGGKMLPQVYCIAVSGKNSAVRFTDDVIFAPDKNALFQVVVFLVSLDELQGVRAMLAGVDAASGEILKAEQATFFLNSTEPTISGGSASTEVVYRLAAGEEFAANEDLCGGRPEPRRYNPYRMREETSGSRFVILRPDRFVFASCNTQEDLMSAAGALLGFLK